MASDGNRCPVCADPNAWSVEQAYLEGRTIPNYSRAQVERHLAHLTDRAALRQVTDLASASGVAARLHRLALTATAVMDRALAEDDGRLALLALREARATLDAVARLSGHLAETAHDEDARPDLDAALESRLGALTPTETPRQATERGPLALPAPGQ